MKIFKRIMFIIKQFLKDESGGSMLESGLLIALALILFLMLLGLVTNLFGWIEDQFTQIFDYFTTI